MKPQIYIDFDGTIVSVWARYYSIMRDYFSLPEDYFDIYKQLKYIYADDKELIKNIFQLDSGQIEKYFEYKRTYLEDNKYLRLDTLLVEPDVLKNFFMATDAKVVTARKKDYAFMEQLDFLKIGFLKNVSYVLKPYGINTKYDWFRQNVSKEPFIIVGDSEVDLQVGKIPHCKPIFVKTGLRDIRFISKDIKIFKTFDNISDCFEYILRMHYR